MEVSSEAKWDGSETEERYESRNSQSLETSRVKLEASRIKELLRASGILPFLTYLPGLPRMSKSLNESGE